MKSYPNSARDGLRLATPERGNGPATSPAAANADAGGAQASAVDRMSLATATHDDLARASQYTRVQGCSGFASPGHDIHVAFERRDGGIDSIPVSELRSLVWWRFIDAVEVYRLEYLMRPPVDWSIERPIHYVARSDRAAGGKLIPGSRLSEYYEGEAGNEAAYEARSRLRGQWPDAGVFDASTIDAAERLLQGIDVSAERQTVRVQEILAEQADSRVRLGAADRSTAPVQPALGSLV